MWNNLRENKIAKKSHMWSSLNIFVFIIVSLGVAFRTFMHIYDISGDKKLFLRPLPRNRRDELRVTTIDPINGELVDFIANIHGSGNATWASTSIEKFLLGMRTKASAHPFPNNCSHCPINVNCYEPEFDKLMPSRCQLNSFTKDE